MHHLFAESRFSFSFFFSFRFLTSHQRRRFGMTRQGFTLFNFINEDDKHHGFAGPFLFPFSCLDTAAIVGEGVAAARCSAAEAFHSIYLIWVLLWC